VKNETYCLPYPLIQCDWTGNINLENPGCQCWMNLIIGPTHGNGQYSILVWAGQAGDGMNVNWNLSINTPPSQSVLTVQIVAPDGTVVLEQNTDSPPSTSLTGSY
jgi:hypothetical protein